MYAYLCALGVFDNSWDNPFENLQVLHISNTPSFVDSLREEFLISSNECSPYALFPGSILGLLSCSPQISDC